jgi:transcription antitermination protein NusB
MGNRRKSRELAMQALFYMDMNQNDSSELLERFCLNFAVSKKARPFFLKLVKGVIQAKPEIDSKIETFSDNWKINRMSCVDRNIMRIAVFELLYCKDIPSKVSINEAIDIGKKFGTDESGAFINGILDSIHIALKKKKIKIAADTQINETG